MRSESDALRDRAMSVGAHVSANLPRILRNLSPAPVSIPEIAAQSIREQAAAARWKRRQAESFPFVAVSKFKSRDSKLCRPNDPGFGTAAKGV